MREAAVRVNTGSFSGCSTSENAADMPYPSKLNDEGVQSQADAYWLLLGLVEPTPSERVV